MSPGTRHCRSCDAGGGGGNMTGPRHGTARQLTGPGRSAIATIRVEGNLAWLDVPKPLFLPVSKKQANEFAIDALHFGAWGDPAEDVVVCRTGKDSLEITCHGGVAAVTRILGDLAGRGFPPESSGGEPAEASSVSASSATQLETDNSPRCPETPRRGDSSTSLRLPLSVLQAARTQRTAEILLGQASGVWDRFIETLSKAQCDEAARLIDQALAWADFGRHLIEPWKVVLCGRPNVGKSSLMNVLAGFTRSIVSAQAGTTRDRVSLETAIQGWPTRITDTAGVRETTDEIEQEGVQQTRAAIDEADLVVIVLDGSEPLLAEDQLLLSLPTRRRIVVAHKADLPVVSPALLPAERLAISSVKREGIEELLQAIAAQLVPTLPPVDQPIPVMATQREYLQALRDLR